MNHFVSVDQHKNSKTSHTPIGQSLNVSSSCFMDATHFNGNTPTVFPNAKSLSIVYASSVFENAGNEFNDGHSIAKLPSFTKAYVIEFVFQIITNAQRAVNTFFG